MQNSNSWKLIKPLRQLKFLVKTLIHFQVMQISVIGTDEHRLVQVIKRIIPSKIFLYIKRVIKARQEWPWTKALTSISKDLGQRILIIGELSMPQCKKYRVDQKVEMFKSLGYRPLVVSWTDYPQARNLLQMSALVIFYRVPAFASVVLLIEEARRLGVTSFFDIDDLIFERKLLEENRNIQNLPNTIQQEVINGAGLYKNALSLADHCMASTSILANYMGNHCRGDSFVIPNCVDGDLLNCIDNKKNESIENDFGIVKIVYGSGTSTHDIDFQEVADALLILLKKYSNVHFVIHGMLTLPESFSSVKSQVIEIPFVKAEKYYEALSHYDINLAPLGESVFNNAKSNIKYLEASVFKIPTVASPVVEYTAIIEHGVDGFLASNTHMWVEALESMILDKKLRQRIGKNAYEKVLREYRIEAVAKSHLQPILKRFLPQSTSTAKKILMVNIFYRPTSFGGATVVIEELSKNINEKKDFEVTIFAGFFDSEHSLTDDYDIVRYEANGVPVILMRFPEPMVLGLEYRNDTMESLFDEILQTIQPDLVHFHSVQNLSASIAKPCINNNIPYFITLHDMWWLCERQFMVMPDGTYCHQRKIDPAFCVSECTDDAGFTYERTTFLKSILEHAELLLAPSAFQAELYLYNDLDPTRVKVNKNGTPFPSKKFTKRKKTKNKVVFAYLGGNADHKGYGFIRGIFETITSVNYEIVVVDLHQKLGRATIFEDDWSINGKLRISDGYDYDQQGLDNFYNRIDVLLFPSQCKESFGLTIREALVRDVWVISTDSGGVIEDIVDGENGNIVPMGDADKFKEKIEECIEREEFYRDYMNPYKDNIRTFHEQADELACFYRKVLSESLQD